MKNTLIIILFLTTSFCAAQILNPQPKEVTQKFFPDFDVEIPTPAFQKKKGFTTYAEMMAFLKPLVEQHQEIATLSYIGESQKGEKIPFLLVNKKKSNQEKVKIWIQAAIHGDEPASTEGVLLLIKKLLTDDSYQYLFDKLEIGIIPMANIDGFNKQLRDAKNGLDLNRDQTKLNAKESIILKQAFSDFNAEVALDFHEYRPFRRDFVHYAEYGVTNPYDVMFLYSGNLNVPENLREFTKNEFVDPAKSYLKENDLRSFDYFSTSDCQGYTCFNLGSINARSSATSYALTNAISTLIEVRGVGLGKTSFKRRTMTTFLIAESYLKSAYENSAVIKEVISEAIQKKDKAVIKSKRDVSKEQMKFIDLATNEMISEEVILRNALKSSATLTRKRPTAYVLLPSQEKLVKRLRVLGLEVKELNKETSAEVEKYTVTNYHRNLNKYEGVHRQELTTETSTVQKEFPSGSYVIDMNQKNSNLAIETLEPEADNSFLSYNVFETDLGEELPYYRYLKQEKL